jgi:hypothetical protein
MGKTKIQPSLARLQAELGHNGQTVQQLDNCEWGAVRGKRLSNSTEQSYRRMCAGGVRLCRKQLSGTCSLPVMLAVARPSVHKEVQCLHQQECVRRLGEGTHRLEKWTLDMKITFVTVQL